MVTRIREMNLTAEQVAQIEKVAIEIPEGKGITTRELAEALGWGRERTRGLIAELKKRGKARAIQTTRLAIDDRVVTVSAYEIEGITDRPVKVKKRG